MIRVHTVWTQVVTGAIFWPPFPCVLSNKSSMWQKQILSYKKIELHSGYSTYPIKSESVSAPDRHIDVVTWLCLLCFAFSTSCSTPCETSFGPYSFALAVKTGIAEDNLGIQCALLRGSSTLRWPKQSLNLESRLNSGPPYHACWDNSKGNFLIFFLLSHLSFPPKFPLKCRNSWKVEKISWITVMASCLPYAGLSHYCACMQFVLVLVHTFAAGSCSINESYWICSIMIALPFGCWLGLDVHDVCDSHEPPHGPWMMENGNFDIRENLPLWLAYHNTGLTGLMFSP